MTSYIIDKDIFKKYKFNYKIYHKFNYGLDFRLPYGTIEILLASVISIGVIVYTNYK